VVATAILWFKSHITLLKRRGIFALIPLWGSYILGCWIIVDRPSQPFFASYSDSFVSDPKIGEQLFENRHTFSNEFFAVLHRRLRQSELLATVSLTNPAGLLSW